MSVEISLRNETEVWKTLELALSGEFDQVSENDDLSIDLDGLEAFNIHLQSGEASISPTMMSGFIALQEGVYRSYGILQYGSRNLNKLTAEEKDALEFAVTVGEGSSDYDINQKNIIEKIIDAVKEKLSPKQIIILVCVLALMYFSHSGFEIYMQQQKDVLLENIKSQQTIELLKSQEFMSAEETKRVELLTRAFGSVPGLPEIALESDNSKQQMLKSFSKNGDVDMGDVLVDQSIAKELAKNPRQTTIGVIFEGEFAIERVDTTSPDGFRVRLRRIADSLIITAGLRDIMLSEDQRNLIKESEWQKRNVSLRIEAKMRGEDIIEATVIEASEVEDKQEGS